MKIEPLKQDRIVDFIVYCKEHRKEGDTTYLHDEDLERFELNGDNPTSLLISEDNIIIGTASLIVNEYFRKGGKGRFRIFHTINQDREAYNLLFQSVLNQVRTIKKIFIHIPEENLNQIKILELLGFYIERYSFSLVKNKSDILLVSFPEGYSIRTFQTGRDEMEWCEISNAGFANLAGSNIPKTPDMIKIEDEEGFIKGGAMILYDNDNPAGMLLVTREVDNGITYAFINAICVKPEYQGKGLGRNLLRTAINFGINNAMPKTMLSVNAENIKAVELYIQEGFIRKYTSICYNYDIKSNI